MTDGELREKMLGNRFAGDIISKLKKLTDNGIKIETQIVLVPSLNDGKYLEKSILDLYSLRPNLQSVAVVPCGITKFREGLFPIKDVTKDYAKCVIEQVKMINGELGENFALLADEFYNKAELPLESEEVYGNFSQIGNGVGGTVKFLSEFNMLDIKKSGKGKYLLVTGESAKNFIEDCAKRVENICKGISTSVLAVKNNFFGESVNCTGLLTACDIISAVKTYDKEYDYLVLPDICLKQDEDLFLDDMTLLEFSKKINKPIIVTDGSAESFIDALTCGKRVRKV